MRSTTTRAAASRWPNLPLQRTPNTISYAMTPMTAEITTSASCKRAIGSSEVSCACESSHGTEAGSEVVLDGPLAGELCAADPGFACRTARTISYCVKDGGGRMY